MKIAEILAIFCQNLPTLSKLVKFGKYDLVRALARSNWQNIANIFLAIFKQKIELREPRRIPRERYISSPRRIPREWCKGVHFVDLGESFPNSNAYLLAKFGFDTAESSPVYRRRRRRRRERALQS